MTVYDKISLPLVYGSLSQDTVDLPRDGGWASEVLGHLVFKEGAPFFEVSPLPSGIVVRAVCLHKRGEEFVHAELKASPKRRDGSD
jgi:hypothetical protein